MSETDTLCPRCGHKVDPNEAGVHYAVEVRELITGKGHNLVEGLGGYFLAYCPVPLGWRPKPLPDHQPSRSV